MIAYHLFPDEDAAERLTVAALEGGRLIGFANVEERAEAAEAELRFVFVEPEHRGRGVAAGLVGALDGLLWGRGVRTIRATYAAEQRAVHRALERAGWAWPLAGTLVCRGSWPKIGGAPLMRISLPTDQETLTFADLPEGALESLRDERWYPQLLGPFLEAPIDPVASLVIRRGGRVVGWSVVHRPSPDRLTYGRLFVHPEHRTRRRGIALVAEGIRRQVAAGILTAGFGVGADNRPMVAFTRRVLARWLDQVTEMLTAEKKL